MSVRYYLTGNPLKPGVERAVLLSGDRASFDAFLSHCEEASTVGRADAIAVVYMMAAWIEQHAGAGREVDFGPLGQTRLGLAGSFDPEAESIRPDEWKMTLGWRVARKLQKQVDQQAKKAGLERRPRPNRGPNVVQVTDLMTHTPDVYSPGGVLELYGSRLKFDRSQPDEGVFFRSESGGAEVRCDNYMEVFPKTIRAIVPATMTGPQRLIVRRRPRPTQPAPTGSPYGAVLGQAR